jgi:putative phage-type endonuclease
MLTAEQLALRKGRIGSSGIAVLAGLNPWSTPFQLWLEVTGREVFDGNEATEIGHDLEPLIGRWGAEKLGLEALEANNMTLLIESWGCATPDFYAYTDIDLSQFVLLECKNVGSTVAHHWRGDEPPPYVQAQCQFQMLVTTVHRCHVSALVGGRERKVYTLEYDAEFAEGLAALGREFHRDYIATDTPPPLDGSEAATSYITKKFGEPDGELIGADDNLNAIATQLRIARKERDSTASELARIENEMRTYIGSNAGVMTSEGTITWRPDKNGKRRFVVPRNWSED